MKPHKNIKDEAIINFSKHAGTYDASAVIQKKSAENLLYFFKKDLSLIPDGPVLEIGCGTGLLSEKLSLLTGSRPVVYSDLSRDMLVFCRKRLETQEPENTLRSFQILDGENIPDDKLYSLIISNFTFQWFEDLAASLQKQKNALMETGRIIFSFPVKGTFREWEDTCREHGMDFHANTLPDESVMEDILRHSGWNGDIRIQNETQYFKTALDFFRSLKRIGAATHERGSALSALEMKKLLTLMDLKKGPDGVKITYRILYASLMKTASE